MININIGKIYNAGNTYSGANPSSEDRILWEVVVAFSLMGVVILISAIVAYLGVESVVVDTLLNAAIASIGVFYTLLR